MNKEKNLVVFLLSFIIIFVILIIFIITFNENDNKKIYTYENNNEIVTVNLKWINYLENSNINSVNVYKEEYDDTLKVSINKDDLKEIFNDIKNKNLIKTYYVGLGSGVTYTLEVNYNNDYYFRIINGNIFIDECDDNLKNIFNSISYDEIKVTNSDEYYYEIDSYDSSFYLKYFSNN